MSLADAVAFVAASGGTGSFVYATAIDSFRTPAQATTDTALVNGGVYSYFAQDSLTAPTQREWGRATYTAATHTFARTSVLGGVSNGSDTGTSPVNFSAAPVVALTVLAEDFSPNYTVHTRTFGAIADGNSHPLSSVYGSLAAAQAVYPFATALTQEIDYCAVQKTFYEAFGYPGSEHADITRLNKRVRIDSGDYVIGGDVLLITKLFSGIIEGDGIGVTTITGTGVAVLQTNGCWYSTFRQFSVFGGAGTTAVLDVDGNIAHDASTNTVQGNSFEDMNVGSLGGTYCFAMVRQGQSFAQGSENTYKNLHLFGCSDSCYYQPGYNALDNNFIGGDMQSYQKNGANIIAGTCHFFGMSFESTVGYQQYLNDGFDISYSSGTLSGTVVFGCRSESMRFLYNDGNPCFTAACNGNSAMNQWSANNVQAVNDGITVPGSNFADNQGRVFAVTAVTGDAKTGATAPTWNVTGAPVTDNHVTWTETVFDFIFNNVGNIDLASTHCTAGRIQSPAFVNQANPGPHTSNYTVSLYDTVVTVDATSGPVTVSIPGQPSGGKNTDRVLTVLKIDTSENIVTIQCVANAGSSALGGPDTFAGGSTTDTLAGGMRSFKTYVYQSEPGGTTPPWWYTINSSSATLVEDTAASILLSTPTKGLLAYATDLGVLLFADGSGWNIDSSYFTAQSTNQDIGAQQFSNRIGYGKDYVTGKALVNCSIGYGSGSPTDGELRHGSVILDGITTNTLQIYQNGEWETISANVALRDNETGENRALEHYPLLNWIQAFSGDSEILGLNGLPIVQGYRVDMGAYPAQQQINGGTF